MKYIRCDALDKYYVVANLPPKTKPKELCFTLKPTLQRNSDFEKKRANCKSCNTMRRYGEYVKTNNPGTTFEWHNVERFGSEVTYTANICVHCMIKLHEEYKETCHINDF